MSIDPSVEQVLVKYSRGKLYGAVEINFQNGDVVLIREMTTIKPQTHRNSREREGRE